jgi:hypothetical protein
MTAALMRRLMSLLTSVTLRVGCWVCSSSALTRMLLSGLLPGIRPGREVSEGRVWKNSLPLAGLSLWPRQRQTLLDLRVVAVGHQLVEKAADLARVARGLAGAFLGVVELFEHDHRHVEVVFFEAEQAGGVVQQDVGVEDEDLALAHECRCSSDPRDGHAGAWR